MKIEKTDSEVLSIRKTTSNKFLITNKKGKEKEIDIVSYYQDDELNGYDNEENIYDENEKEISWSDLEEFLGDDDVDELQDKISDLIRQ